MASETDQRTGLKRRKVRSREELKSAIVAAATELFSEQGYDVPSIRDIAQAAGVAVPAVYRLFVDKRDLYVNCCRYAFKRHWAILDSMIQPDDEGEVVLYKLTWIGFDFKKRGNIDYRLIGRLAQNNETDLIMDQILELRNSAMMQKMISATSSYGHSMPVLRHMILLGIFHEVPQILSTWPNLEIDFNDTDHFTISVLSVIFPLTDWKEIASLHRPCYTVSP